MSTDAGSDRDWFKSSRSANNAACIEVRFRGGQVSVRDSKDQDGPRLAFDVGAWSSFVAGLKTSDES